jgi:hypothetical protein
VTPSLCRGPFRWMGLVACSDLEADGRRPAQRVANAGRPGFKANPTDGGAEHPRLLLHDHRPVPSSPSGAELPPGLTTLRRWAARQGRTYDHVRQYWRKLRGFPEPAGTLEPAEHRRGRHELVFDEAALDAWLASRPELAPPTRVMDLQVDPDERITLGRFATLIGRANKTVTQHRGRPNFPQAGVDGLYRVGDLIQYWNTRLGRRN